MALGGLRTIGQTIAPKLTRQTERWVKSARPVFDAIGGVTKSLANTGDAYLEGDLAKGVQGARDVYRDVRKTAGVIKSTLGKRKRGGPQEGRMNKVARGGTSAETGEGSGMPRMSGDQLARISKAANVR